MKLISRILAYKYLNFKKGSLKPLDQQERLFKKRKKELKGTEIYKDLNLREINSYSQLCSKISVKSYNFYKPYIEKTLQGTKDVLFKDDVVFFSVTSGTTSSFLERDGKRIPYNQAMISNYKNYYKKIAGMIINHNRDFNFLKKNRLVYGNCSDVIKKNTINIPEGYISGFLSKSVVKKSKNRFPNHKTLEILDWDEKSKKIIEECKNKDIQILSGIPIYIINLLEVLLLETGAKNVKEIWPNIETVIYAGTSAEIFKERIEGLCGKKLNYYGGYVASEGALGITVCQNEEKYILNTDEILFSFTSLKNNLVYGIDKIKLNEVYKLNISMPNGMIQYETGDLLKFIDNQKGYVFKITGRDKVSMNMSGEKVTEAHMISAISQSSKIISNVITHYFVYPAKNLRGRQCYGFCLFLKEDAKFDKEKLALIIDNQLINLSEDYKDSRLGDKVLDIPIVRVLSSDIEKKYFKEYSNKGQLKLKSFFSSEDEINEFLSQFI